MRQILAAFLLSCLIVGAGYGQGSQAVKRAINMEGIIVNDYDRFKDESTINLFTWIKGERADGVGLMLICPYVGMNPRAATGAFFSLVATGKNGHFNKSQPVIWLVDGERQSYLGDLAAQNSAAPQVQFFVVVKIWQRDELLKLAAATKVEARLGDNVEFELTAKNKQLIRQFAERMAQ